MTAADGLPERLQDLREQYRANRFLRATAVAYINGLEQEYDALRARARELGEQLACHIDILKQTQRERDEFESRLRTAERDAERFNYLQNADHKHAQQFFWNYLSRKQRAEAIDKAIDAARGR